MADVDFIEVGKWIIERLKQDVKELKAVETYVGQVEGDVEKIPVRSPSAFVAYGGSKYTWSDGPVYEESPAFTVLLIVKSLKAEESAEGPDRAYTLIKDILASLTNTRPSSDMEMLQPVSSRLVFQGSGIFVYGIEFRINFDTTYQW